MHFQPPRSGFLHLQRAVLIQIGEKGKRGNEFLLPGLPGINKPARCVGTRHNTTAITHSLPLSLWKNERRRSIRRNKHSVISSKRKLRLWPQTFRHLIKACFEKGVAVNKCRKALTSRARDILYIFFMYKHIAHEELQHPFFHLYFWSSNTNTYSSDNQDKAWLINIFLCTHTGSIFNNHHYIFFFFKHPTCSKSLIKRVKIFQLCILWRKSDLLYKTLNMISIVNVLEI